MAGGGRCPRRRRSMRRRRGASKLDGRGGRKENDDIIMKPGSRIYGEWICVRGHRIRRSGRMRVDDNGDVYVPDSEDEESGMKVDPRGLEVADSGAASVTADCLQMVDGVMGDGVDVTAEGVHVDAVEVAAEGVPVDGIKLAADATTGEEMHPVVAARLKMLVDHMDPSFRDVFVSMYKPTEIMRGMLLRETTTVKAMD